MKRRLISCLILPALMLAACNSTPPLSPGPAAEFQVVPPSGSMGLFEVIFTGGGNQPLTAQARPIGLKAQGLTVQPTVALAALSRGDFDLDGQRYLQATFSVLNQGATDLTNLTFLAVATNQTSNGTPIANLRRFDGSPADPTIAQQIRPTHPLNLVSARPQVIQENADFQAYSEAEVGPTAFPRPAEVLDVFPYGFVANVPSTGSRTLTAGSNNGQVTVALKVPLQSSSNANPFTFSLMVEAVTDNAMTVTQSPEEFGTNGPARVQARVAALQALYPGTPVTLKTVGCPAIGSLSPLRTAGTTAAPVTTIGPPLSLLSFTPRPFLQVSDALPMTSTFSAAFDHRVQGQPESFSVQGSQTGAALRLSGAGTYLLTRASARPWHPGEEVEVALTRSLRAEDGSSLCTPFSAQYRIATQPESAPGLTLATQQLTGDSPFSVVLGDLNEDGQLDAVTGNIRGNSVSVLLGNGNGTFQPQIDLAVGLRPQAIALKDINLDGHLDLLTSNLDANTVTVLLGKGDGSFQPRQDIAAGNSPYSMAVRDMNGDGRPDLMTADFDGHTVSLLLGNGDGTFQPKTEILTSYYPMAITVNDINGDGVPDLLTTGDNLVTVLLGKGDGTFQSKPDVQVGNNPNSITTGDVNGDGHLDLAAVNFSDSTLSLLLGRGDGTFQPQQIFAVGEYPDAVVMADVNGDRQLDIVVANLLGNDVSILFGSSDGTLQVQQRFSVGAVTRPGGVALGDVNGDGKLDILTANTIAKSVSVLLKK